MPAPQRGGDVGRAEFEPVAPRHPRQSGRHDPGRGEQPRTLGRARQGSEPGARRCVVGERRAELGQRRRKTLHRLKRLHGREFGETPPVPGVGECVRDQMVVGGIGIRPVRRRPGRGFAQPAGERGERVGTSELGVAQRQVVRMHGRAAMREEASRLEQRQPGAQSGGEVVRSGRDGGLEPGDRVLGAGQRN